jgi:hypothetical protein
VLQESGATEAIHDGIFDAMLLRNGVLHWFVDEKTRVEGSKHTGLDEMALGQLIDDSVEVLEQSSKIEMQPVPPEMAAQYQAQGIPVPEGVPVELFDVKIKRTIKEKKPRIISVPMDEFLISSDALCVDDSGLVGQGRKVSRSDLVAMGYDRDKIESLPSATETATSENERYSRRKYANDISKANERENDKIDYYDLYVRLDRDNDGIAELRHICMAGGLTAEHLLVDDYASDVPYADLVIERQPHQWEGVSIADDVMDIQRIKTALLQSAMNNIYWQNALQMIVNSSAIENPEAVMRPEFGRPIMLKDGYNARDAISYNIVPFVANNILEFIGYWDDQVSDRTGIDDTSAGMPADALQNVTAKASAMMEQKGIARVEMLVRTLATGGLKRLFKGLLKLIIENQDKARTVRMRDKWVEVDARSWNAEMDATINTGLGAGTRERDMMVMQGVISMQEKLLASLGPDNPFVKPDNVWKALSGLVEASGLKTPSMYFTKPDEAEVTAALDARKNAKPIELQKIEAQAMADKALREAEMPLEMRKMELEVQAAAEKERAQSQAAVDEAIALAEIQATDKQSERDLKYYEINQRLAFEREKLALDQENAAEKSRIELQKHAAGQIGEKIANMQKEGKESEKQSELAKALNAPKRVIRDENGEITGIEPVN